MISKVLKNVLPNAELEASLKAALVSSQSRVQLATEAKLATIVAIEEHARLLRSAVDGSQVKNFQRFTLCCFRSLCL